MSVPGRPRRLRGGARWSATLAGALAVAVSGVLSGCSPLRNGLGTSNGPCYVALPAASAAVHGSGRLVGVRLVAVPGLRRAAPSVYAVASVPGGAPVSKVCLVAYSGRFSSSSVSMPRGRPGGRLAVVVLVYPGNRLLGTIIFRHIPLEFGHARLGPA
jgi:hypothetical protein